MSRGEHWSGKLRGHWLRRGWLNWLLLPVSCLYASLIRVRNIAYRSGLRKTNRCAVPVIVVGNVVAGGVGKTPVVIEIVRHLQQIGHKPGIVSRGYGRAPQKRGALPLHVSLDSLAETVGDEPLLLHKITKVPVCVAKDRFHAAQALLAAHPDITIIVCDDGLQHLALHADVSIVVFDERQVGNGWLLPAGLLRERWPHGTGRAVDMVLLALPPDTTAPVGLAVPRTCPPPFLARKALAGTAYNCVGERRPLETFIPQPTIALAGIAKPELFFEMLSSAGIQPELTIAMADHQELDEKTYSNLSKEIGRREVLMTEKDSVKFCSNHLCACQEDLTGEIEPPKFTNRPQTHFWAVPLTLEIENSFFTALDAKLSSRHGLQTP